MNKEELCQGSEAWHEMRKNKIGASDAAAILGVSPFKTPLQLYREKLGLETQFLSPAMARGTALETQALDLFELAQREQFFPTVVFHKEHDFMMASLDGLSLDGKHAVEIKCPGAKTHAIALAGKVPEHYIPQLQHQMACADLPSITYYSYDGEEGVAIKVDRDDVYIAELIELERLFFEMVKAKTPPPLTERDYVEHEDSDWAYVAEQYQQVCREYNDIQDKKDDLKEKLVLLSENQNSKGAGLTVTKSVRRGNVEYSKIPELKNVDLDSYRKGDSLLWTVRTKN